MRHSSAVLCLVAVIGCAHRPRLAASSSPSGGAPFRCDKEEYAVWSTLLNDFTVMRGYHSLVVIKNPAEMDHSLQIDLESGRDVIALLRTRLPELTVETARSFMQHNQTPVDMEDHFRLENPLGVKTDVAFLSRGDDVHGWDEFYARYPEARGVGVVWLSRVGFDAAGTQALVTIGRQSHSTSGIGQVILLRCRKGMWEIAAREMIWVS